MKKLLVISAIAASLTLGACASTPEASAKSEYDATVEKATMLQAQAKAAGNVWKQKAMKLPYTEDYLAQADEAKKKGNDAEALRLAKEALKTAEAQLVQNERHAAEKPAWYK